MALDPAAKPRMKGWQVVVVTNTILVALFLVLLNEPNIQALDERISDFWMRLRYHFTGPVVDPNIALVGIDDKSRNPEYSEFADRKDSGGWRTRLNYVLQLYLFRELFHPRVIAYDILFNPGTAQDRKERSRNVESLLKGLDFADLTMPNEAIQKVEVEGFEKMAAQISYLEDAREAGISEDVVLGFRFPEKELQERKNDPDWKAKEKEQFELARTYAFPNGAVIEAGAIAVKPRVDFPERRLTYGTTAMLGALNVDREVDGSVRRVPLVYALEAPDGSDEKLYLPSLAFQSLLLYWGIKPSDLKPPEQGLPSISIRARDKVSIRAEGLKRDIPIDAEGRLFLNQRFKHTDVSNVSFVDANENGLRAILKADGSMNEEERKTKQTIEGKIALVAEMGTGILDIGNFALESYVPNGMAHLFVMDNVLREDYVRPLLYQGQATVLLVLAILCTVIFSTGARRFAIWFTSALIPLYLLVYVVAFGAGAVFPLILPVAMLMTMTTSGYFLQYSEAAAQRQQVRLFFSKMVSSSVLDILEKNPDQATLTGEKREATMFFSDLANFTSISERLSAGELSKLLNRYLTPMTHIILENDGYVDKFSGDGIMADWGVPVSDPMHAVKACRAAMEQQREVERLALEIRNELGIEIYVRMGLNSGVVSAGNMGAEEKFQYTVMGDAVNLAARLEPANKDYKTRVILGQGTYELAQGKIVARMLDRLVVKGKTEPVTIYELLDAPADGAAVVIPEWVAHYERGYRLHTERKWRQAREAFLECIRIRGVDGASEAMLARVALYEIEEPPDHWRGEWVRKAKD